mgnify:CR=1 FL=1
MVQTEWKPKTQRIIPILPEEIEDFDEQVRRFKAGQWDETEFQAFRLKQGVYGQRQADAGVGQPQRGERPDQVEVRALRQHEVRHVTGPDAQVERRSQWIRQQMRNLGGTAYLERL